MRRRIMVLMSVMAFVTGCTKKSSLAPVSPPVASTYPFFVDLQEGFTGMPVSVSINASLLYAGNPMTQPVKGIAHCLEGSATSSLITIRVEVPSHNIDKEQQFDISQTNGIGIYLQDEKITILQAKGFAYE